MSEFAHPNPPDGPQEPDIASSTAVPSTGVAEFGTADGAPTGNLRVDQALDRLTELDALPTSEHADVYEDVHRRLQAALTELDDV